MVFLEVDVDDCQVRGMKSDAAGHLTVSCPLESTLFFKVKMSSNTRSGTLSKKFYFGRMGHVPVLGVSLDTRSCVQHILKQASDHSQAMGPLCCTDLYSTPHSKMTTENKLTLALRDGRLCGFVEL